MNQILEPTQQHPQQTDISTLKLFTQRILSFSILALLFATIVAGTSENMHAQMLKLGAYVWDDYFILRGEQPVVDCELNIDIDARIEELAVVVPLATH